MIAKLVGTRYVENGRDAERDGGLDCWGLAREVIRMSTGHSPPLHLIDGKELRAAAFEGGMAAREWVPCKKPVPWCLAVFHFHGGEWHCGVVLPDRARFIHCRRPAVIIERLDSPIWRNILKGYFIYEPAIDQ